MFSYELVGFIAGSLGIFFGVPQALRVRRLGHGRGVSLFSWLLQFGVATSWAAYGFDVDSRSLLIMNIGAGVINASVIISIIQNKLKSFLILATFIVVLSLLVLTLPSALVSALLVTLVFSQSPQIVKSFKNIRSEKDSAVSIPAMSVGAASNFLWLMYALLIDDNLLKVSTTIAFSTYTAVIVLELIGKRVRRLKTA